MVPEAPVVVHKGVLKVTQVVEGVSLHMEGQGVPGRRNKGAGIDLVIPVTDSVYKWQCRCCGELVPLFACFFMSFYSHLQRSKEKFNNYKQI